MARLFSEGFETQSLANWTALGYSSQSFQTGRTGGRGSHCCRLVASGSGGENLYYSKDLGSNYTEIYTRAYYRIIHGNTLYASEMIRFLDSAGTDVLSVRCNDYTANQMYVYRTTNLEATVTPLGWSGFSWFLLETYTKINGSETIFTVKIDGSEVYTETWAATTGAGNIRTVQYMCYSWRSESLELDDVAFDDAGWIGNGSIVALLPTSTESVGLTGSDADQTDNHLLVDERAPDADTTYVYAASAAEDRYGLGNLSPALGAGESINGVWCTVRARLEGASTLDLRFGTKSGGTTTYETTVTTLTTNYVTLDGPYRAVDPNTSAAWSESAVNALELIAGAV